MPNKKRDDIAFEIIDATKLPATWHYEYNARQPSPISKAYKAMRQTIENEPASFLRKNGGIVLVNDEYILDGGHTYLAIMDARKDGQDVSQVRVKVFKEHSDNIKDIVLQSEGLNDRVTPPLYGIRDLKGDWDGIKHFLDKKYAKWFQFRPNANPTAAYEVKFLVALLHGWWPGANREGKVSQAYANKGVLVKLYDEDKYRPILERINDAIDLWSYVAKTIAELPEKEKRKVGSIKDGYMRLPNGEEIQVSIPEPFIWLIYCALGVLIDKNGQWTVNDPKAVLEERWGAMWKVLAKEYKENGSNFGYLGKNQLAYANIRSALVMR